jgi:hypothetical protein
VDLFAELTAVLSGLDSGGVDYALCGAVALAVYGAPRATQDIDILVRASDVETVREVGRAAGFTLEAHPMRFASGFTVHRLVKMIEAQPFMLDVIEAEGALLSIWETRKAVRSNERELRVVSREGLITMKLAAGRPQDIADVQRLQELGRG